MHIQNAIKLLENQMKVSPNNIAIKYGDRTFTYKELDKITFRIAYYLNTNNIGIEDVIGIYIERSYLSVCATIGILRSGAAFLPIDIKIPPQRVSHMINISKAKLILYNDNNNNINPIFVDINEIVNNNNFDIFNDNISIKFDNFNLAYVIFTSGSTGLPKGVLIEHGGMNNHLSEKINILGLDSNSIIAHNASISFDISVWQILAPLCVGGILVIFPENSIMNIREFIDIINKEEISILEVVPAYLNLIISECKKHKIKLKSLKYILSTGEELTEILVNRWFDFCHEVPLINAYGPTEASDDITHCIIKEPKQYDIIPIGKPIDNINLYVYNENGVECSHGEKGELWVSGICVSRGYIGNANETQKHFIVDKKTGYRLYKTGDLVCLETDGNYYYHGRIDNQIKLHGNRIEIKEIENRIASFKEIDGAAVVFDKNREQLNAVYISKTQIDSYCLKQYLIQQLPSYMVPLTYTRIDKIPVNINGKTDYSKVSEYIFSMFETSNSCSIVNDLDESIIRNIILEILDISSLPSNDVWKDDMVIIGFDSICAIRLIVAIEEKYGFEFEDVYLSPELLYNFNNIKNYVQLHK